MDADRWAGKCEELTCENVCENVKFADRRTGKAPVSCVSLVGRVGQNRLLVNRFQRSVGWGLYCTVDYLSGVESMGPGRGDAVERASTAVFMLSQLGTWVGCET